MTYTAMIGVGGCGMNVLEYMAERLPEGSCTIGINRDAERLGRPSNIQHQVLLDELSAIDEQGDLLPAGKTAVQTVMQSHWQELKPMLHDADSVCILAGLGGATGSWGSGFLLQHVNDLGKPTIMLAVTPFPFEKKRCEVARHVLDDLKIADHLLVCPNQQISEFLSTSTLSDGFLHMHQVIFEALNQSINE